jgi:hypothetical protein
MSIVSLILSCRLIVGFGREDTMNRAARDLGPSELLDVRWKRIILGEFGLKVQLMKDEGHTAGRITSNAMRLAQSLNTERKWAVTGSESSQSLGPD